MRQLRRGIILLAVACAFAPWAHALAAPERLGDLVPDAVPDQEGAWAFSWGRESLDLEGPLNAEQTARDFFKLRYTFTPKVSASIKYTYNDMAGGLGLVSPVLDDIDSGTSLTADIGINLMKVDRVNADTAKGVAFAAGSSFGIGVSGTQYKLKTEDLSQDETLITAYLLYSTDLTEEMRAHTYFSSGRLSGDAYTGSVNRVGAGLDYALIPGKRPLELMVNGVLDIYNFRSPTFNTSRVSRFDVGMRYRVANDWFATLGWATVNDSENNSSGSGIFGGLNYCQMPKPKKECPPAPAEAAPAAAPQADAGAQPLPLASIEQPPLMAQAPVDRQPSQLQDQQETPAEPAADITSEKAVSSASAEETAAAEDAGAEDNGIAIPEFPQIRPQPTPEGAVMLRAGADPTGFKPRQTSATDLMLRAPLAEEQVAPAELLIAEPPAADEPVLADAGEAAAQDAAPETAAADEAVADEAATDEVAEEDTAGILELAALPPAVHGQDAPAAEEEQDDTGSAKKREASRTRRFFSSKTREK